MSNPPSPSAPRTRSLAWYREPWPWILMSGPAAVVVAGLATAYLAVVSFDGLVADDYYRQGLGINRDIARGDRARALGVVAAVAFNGERSEVRVVLSPPTAAGTSLRLRLTHPTRAHEDQSIVLGALTPGVYDGFVEPLRHGRWRIAVEDPAGGWRVAGTWATGEAVARLEAGSHEAR
jgi:uncharacterized protein